jgi:polar amino acid transport system substrate-binding protein
MNAFFKSLAGIGLLLFLNASSAQRLTVYCEEDFPVQYYDKSGHLTGFSIEIVREIQKRLNIDGDVQVVPWSRGMDKLNNDPNTMLITMAKTPEREPLYQWVGPIISVDYGLYGKANSDIKIKSLEDAKKVKSIGVYRNDIRDQTLTRLGFKNLDRADSNTSSFKKLMIGRISLYAENKLGAERIAISLGYRPNVIKLIFPLFKSYLYFGVSRNTSPEIVQKWNDALSTMKKDETFLAIQKKYFSEYEIKHQ